MLILILDLGRELRGGQRQVLYLASALAGSAEFSPLLACPAGSPLALAARQAGLPVLPLAGGGAFNPLNLFRLGRALGKSGRDCLIHTNDAKAAGLGALLLRLKKDCLLVHSRRVSYPLRPGWRGAKYRLGHAVVGVSEEIADNLRRGGIAPERVAVIHSGIDPSRYEAKRERNDGRLVFVSVGALTSQKGYTGLISALPHLASHKELPPWELRIVGEGPLFESLLALAESLGVAGHISLLGRQDSRQILPGCDVMVCASTAGEGSSATIKEAWAVGLPLVCSDLPSNLELVDCGKNGLCFPVGHDWNLAMQMIRAGTNAELCRQLVAAGRESLKNFTHTKMSEAYLALYRKLFAERAA